MDKKKRDELLEYAHIFVAGVALGLGIGVFMLGIH